MLVRTPLGKLGHRFCKEYLKVIFFRENEQGKLAGGDPPIRLHNKNIKFFDFRGALEKLFVININ